MLRLPRMQVCRPRTVAEALRLLDEPGIHALVIAGGTDLVPNMKHGLFTPDRLVALQEIPGLAGIELAPDGALAIGALTTLERVAADALVRERAPALAQAAGLVAGPQLRTMGTLGGNVLLDTRCQWYNQTHFWREALGYCLKKDGTVCHVVAGGQKCVAAASNDTVPALLTLGAELNIEGPAGPRSVALDDFWRSDGIYNKKLTQKELLLGVRIPPSSGEVEHRGAYGKLRTRGSIDFPQLGVAVRLDLAKDGSVADADVVVTALAARPVRIRQVAETLRGLPSRGAPFEAGARAVADQAHKQCTPLDNIPGDADYRKEMVPVYVRRTLLAAAAGTGPVHHV